MGKALIDERYELRGLVGSGGMAYVHLAHDNVLDRDVALKLLKSRYAENEELVERFRREARSAASLSHPHIVPVFDGGATEDGTHYITMEYLPGGTLKDRITSEEKLPPQRVVEVGLQIAEALQCAHERGVIHRDIKPRNILITASGHMKVADFGIARAVEGTTISESGDILGSAKYMSPEQAAGERVSPASDLYSLGVVLYEMLTGSVPFEVEIPADLSARHEAGPPPRPREVNPEIPEAVDSLVMRLLAADPEDRYESATHLVKELRRVREGLSPGVSAGDDATTAALGTPLAPTLPAPGVTALRGRRLGPVLPALVLLALLIAAGGAAGWTLLRDPGAAGIPQIPSGTPEEPSEKAVHKPAGPKEVEVPGVVGLGEQEARKSLADAGFDVGIRHRESPEEDVGNVLEQSVAGGKEAKEGTEIVLTVGQEAPQLAKEVPDLVGLSYSDAESELEEAGLLLGGVKEATSETVPEGVIMKQNPPPGTTLEPDSYVFLTTSVGPPETAVSASQQESASAASSSEEGAVAVAVRAHYDAIGRGDFEDAYSYFGPSFRSQHDAASWISGEQSYEIQDSTIHSLRVEQVSGTTATATVDVSFVDKTGTPRFVIVWRLVKEGGRWKLDSQISAQRVA